MTVPARSRPPAATAAVAAIAAVALATSLVTGPLAPSPAAAAEAGEPAPDFTLTDTDGVEHSLASYREQGKTVVLEWFNPDCPFVKKHHQKTKSMAETRAAFADVVWLAINSGAPGKQGYGVERNARARTEYGIEYPVLLDPEGTVGRAYGAKTTPQMFVIASDGTVLYAGAIDDDSTTGAPGQHNHVKKALAELARGEKIEVAKSKPYGCSVKYGSPGS